jgi:Tfp pilus assembly protein PilO
VNPKTWLRRWYLWAPAGVLVLANVVWLAGVRGALLGRGPALAARVREVQSSVTRLTEQKAALEHSAAALTSLEGNLGDLRGSLLGSMHDRLIPFLKDVVQRTEEAGLHAERVAYTAQPDKKSGLVYFSASYAVKGSYEQIRRCVYLLETSPQFVMIDSLGLRSQEVATSVDVSVQLIVGTYFSDLDEALLQQLGISETRHAS